jgi:hypothetical protein
MGLAHAAIVCISATNAIQVPSTNDHDLPYMHSLCALHVQTYIHRLLHNLTPITTVAYVLTVIAVTSGWLPVCAHFSKMPQFVTKARCTTAVM